MSEAEACGSSITAFAAPVNTPNNCNVGIIGAVYSIIDILVIVRLSPRSSKYPVWVQVVKRGATICDRGNILDDQSPENMQIAFVPSPEGRVSAEGGGALCIVRGTRAIPVGKGLTQCGGTRFRRSFFYTTLNATTPQQYRINIMRLWRRHQFRHRRGLIEHFGES